MKSMNIKESLIRLDKQTDFKYTLTDLYEACRLDDEKKCRLVQYIDDKDIQGMSRMLSNEAGVMTENVSDDISDDEIKEMLGEDSLEEGREWFDRPGAFPCDEENLSSAIDATMHSGNLSYGRFTDNHLVTYMRDDKYEVKHKVNGERVRVEFDTSDPCDSTLKFTVDGTPFVANYPSEAQDIIISELEKKNWNQFDVVVDNFEDDNVDGELLNEGPGAVLGDLAGKAVGDAWKGVKNFAKGVKDTAKDVAKTTKAVAQSAHTDWKQSKTRSKVVDAARAIKDADTVDQFKANYQQRQAGRKLSNKARTQSYQGKLGKSIGDMQDWKFEVNGKKLTYDQFMKLPEKNREYMIKNKTVKCYDLMGKPITVQDQAKRLSGLKLEKLLLNEGPGAGYTIESSGYEMSGTLNSVKMRTNVNKWGRTDYIFDCDVDLKGYVNTFYAEAYYNNTGEQHDLPIVCDRVRVEIDESDLIRMGVFPEEYEDTYEFDEANVSTQDLYEIIIDSLSGARCSFTYGGGWSHASYDGQVTEDYLSDVYLADIEANIYLADEDDIRKVDRMTQGYGYETQYEVVIDGVGEECFEDEYEAIEYAQKNGAEFVRTIYVSETWDGDFDVDGGDIIWEAGEEFEESLRESTSSGKTFSQWFDETSSDSRKEFYPWSNYVKSFPNAEVLANATAEDIKNNAHIFYDVYDVDSDDREKAFHFASEELGMDYDDFYYAWLREKPIASNLQEKGLTRAERHNRNMEKTFDYKKQTDNKMMQFLRDNSDLSEEEIKKAYDDDKLGLVIKELGLHDAFWSKNESLTESACDYVSTYNGCAIYEWNGKFICDCHGESLSAKSEDELKRKIDSNDISYRNHYHNLGEDWTHFEFKSGSNPYIAKDEKEKSRLLKKYGNKAKEIKPNYYMVDDSEDDRDLFSVEEEISSVDKPVKFQGKSSHTFTKDKKWDVDFDEVGNISARTRQGKPHYFKGHINDTVNDFPSTDEDNIILAAREQHGLKFSGNKNGELSEAFTPADSGIQSVKVYNPYNYTIQELRIDNDAKTFERGNFTMGKPDKKFKNRQQYEDVVDQLKELGYKEIDSDYKSLRNKSRKGTPTNEEILNENEYGKDELWLQLNNNEYAYNALSKIVKNGVEKGYSKDTIVSLVRREIYSMKDDFGRLPTTKAERNEIAKDFVEDELQGYSFAEDETTPSYRRRGTWSKNESLSKSTKRSLNEDILNESERFETSHEWEHKDKDGRIGRIRQSDGKGDRKPLTRDQAKEIAKFRGHEDDELYPVKESKSMNEDGLESKTFTDWEEAKKFAKDNKGAITSVVDDKLNPTHYVHYKSKKKLKEDHSERYRKGSYCATINTDAFENPSFEDDYLPMDFDIRKGEEIIDTVRGLRNAKARIDDLIKQDTMDKWVIGAYGYFIKADWDTIYNKWRKENPEADDEKFDTPETEDWCTNDIEDAILFNSYEDAEAFWNGQDLWDVFVYEGHPISHYICKYSDFISNGGKNKYLEAFEHPQNKGPYWYLCKHGIGPGAIPKGVTVVDTMDDDENPNRCYVALDKVLTTDELKQFEMKEQKPKNLHESVSEDSISNMKVGEEKVFDLNNGAKFETFTKLHVLKKSDEMYSIWHSNDDGSEIANKTKHSPLKNTMYWINKDTTDGVSESINGYKGIRERLNESDEPEYLKLEIVPDNRKWQYSVGGKDVPYTSYEDAKSHLKDDYNILDYRDELQQYIKSMGAYFFVDATFDGRLCIEINWGDWKHDHQYADYLVQQFFNELGLSVSVDEEVTEDDGSDTYSAIRYYEITDLYFSGRPIDENLNEDYDIKNVNGHFEVYKDDKFICSADTKKEAEEEVQKINSGK